MESNIFIVVHYNYELLHGLRKDVNSEVYKLYSEKYTILWLDAHWNRVCSLISENISYDKDIHDVIDFFVSEFKNFIDSMERNDVYSSVLFFENLKIKT